MWLKYGLKAQKLQEAARSKRAEIRLSLLLPHTPWTNGHRPKGKVKGRNKTIPAFTPHALKGQKPLAQGIALGNYGRKPVAL